MKKLLLGAALAVAALSAACSTTQTTTAGAVATSAVQNQATIRASVERAFSTYADGIEAAVQSGIITTGEKGEQASHLAAAHGVLLVGRAGFIASGALGSADLIAAQAQADADFTRVAAELQGG